MITDEQAALAARKGELKHAWDDALSAARRALNVLDGHIDVYDAGAIARLSTAADDLYAAGSAWAELAETPQSTDLPE